MMKNKIARYVVNGALLAVMAAVGITVYQLGTSSSGEENLPGEIQSESYLAEADEETEDLISEDAGTSLVEAQMESELETDGALDAALSEESESLTEDGTESGAEGESTDAEETADVSAGVLTLPELDFSENTLMEWPVNGNILLDYSMDQTTYFPTLDQYKLNPAIAEQAVEGAPVMASVSGIVYAIEEDAQTGTTVTMELGNGFQAIYGQLRDLTVAEGDTVTKGTIIGYVDTPTKYYSREGSNVYFAMKENGEPVDPIAYLP